jgi:hypothetical protein
LRLDVEGANPIPGYRVRLLSGWRILPFPRASGSYVNLDGELT